MGKSSQSHGEATERFPVRLTCVLEEDRDGPGEEGNLKRQQLEFSKWKKAVSPPDGASTLSTEQDGCQ